MSAGAGFCAESKWLFDAVFGLAPDRPVFERGLGDDGDSVVLAVTELACSQITAVAATSTGGLLGCVC